MSAAGGGGAGTLLLGLLAEIERVVKVLSSKMQRPTQSTTYQTEREDVLRIKKVSSEAYSVSK